MIRIAICDDNEDFRQYEYGLVNDIMYSINCVCETDFFPSMMVGRASGRT